MGHGLAVALNEGVTSGSIKCGEFLDGLRSCSLLTKNSAPWS
jgi:hypothetical protein